MKLKARLLCYSAALMLTTSAAFAAIDGNALADAYLAEGYTYVEVKVGPTQTKVEAIKGDIKVEVIYDNETQEIIKRDQERADAEDRTREGKDVRTVKSDFEGDDDGDHKGRSDDDDDANDDDHGGDHNGDKDGNDDDHGDDHDGHDGGRDGDDD
jgi:hypothetical protein